MSKADLVLAVEEFSRLTGYKLNSKLVESTLDEGEYKDSVDSADPEDDLEIPDFLRRDKKPGERTAGDQIADNAKEYRDKNRGKPAKESQVSEQVLDQATTISYLNKIQDHGYVRAKTSRISESTNEYTFVHHRGTVLQVKVQKLAEGFRLTGCDQVLCR